ncbi:MAG: leucine-rich repeat domain-containing protein, partial [Clostridia bacterium]|nr:leucine-rich repeat domain-containing protein [Clostridia bacterium]
MKKVLSVLLVMTMLIAVLPTNVFHLHAHAAGTVNDLAYTVENGEAIILKCQKLDPGDVVIPSTLEGSPVTTIEEGAFLNCIGLTSVTIPNSVTTIRASAFSGCTGLTKVTMTDGLEVIGDQAFYACESLTSVAIPSSVTSIDNDTFGECLLLESITVDEDNTAYCSVDGVLLNKGKTQLLFYPDGKTESAYTIPDGVTAIPGQFFSGNTKLTSVVIPNSVNTIGIRAFIRCSNLESVRLGNGVTSIDGAAFYGCDKLATVYYSGDEETQAAITIGTNNEPLQNATWLYVIDDSNVGSGEETVPNELVYTITDGEVTITDCDTAATGVLKIPAKIEGYPVTSIGKYAFYGCTSLTGITIPDSVTSIGGDAFFGCSSLTSITIPDSVMSIGSSAFYDTAFYNNSANWKDNALYIGNHLIEVQAEISGAYAIKENTKTIAGGAFEGCSALTTVTIPDSVTSIGTSTFEGCSALTTATIPNSVTSIGDAAFLFCESLNSITIPNSVTSIGELTFCYCSSLTDILIPATVTTVEDSAFYSANLKNVWYGGSAEERALMTIGANNENLAAATWTYNICEIDGTEHYEHYYDYACDPDCAYCSYTRVVEHIYDDVCDAECNECLDMRDPPHYFVADCVSYCEGCGQEREPVAPHAYDDACDEYCNNCWAYREAPHDYEHACDDVCDTCGQMRYTSHVYTGNYDIACDACGEVVLSYLTYTVTNGEVTITDCNTKASGPLTIPSVIDTYPVTAIADKAFYDCASLTEIVIPDSVTSLGTSVFRGCSAMTSVTLPNGITTVGEWMFGNCDSLVEVTIPHGVTTLGIYTFYDCDNLKSVTIPSTVKSIGTWAFFHCDSLESITIPYGVTTIEEYLFEYCVSLKSVSIPSTVTSIGTYAFSDCNSLESITIPNSVKTIGKNAFLACYELTSVTIPSSVTSIGDMAFAICNNLERIDVDPNNTAYCSVDGVLYTKDMTTLLCVPMNAPYTEYRVPDSVTSIAYGGFNRCANLKKVTIPKSVTSVGKLAFYGCTALTDVCYIGTEADRQAMTIEGNNDPLTKATWQYDICGGEHTWDEGKVTTEATATTTGVLTYTCTGCGETKTEVIPQTLRFQTASLTLESSVQVNFLVQKAVFDAYGYTDAYAVFEIEERTGNVK